MLRGVRIRALERGTSVNAVLRELLAAYAGASDEQQRAVRSLLEIAGRTHAGRGRAPRVSLRDALIVQAAVASGCTRLLTEDLQDEQVADGVRVENPFRDAG